MTPAQLGKIRSLMREGGLGLEDVMDLAEEVTGSPVVDLESLDTSEASSLIERLEDGRI